MTWDVMRVRLHLRHLRVLAGCGHAERAGVTTIRTPRHQLRRCEMKNLDSACWIASMSSDGVGGHEILPSGGHVAARWRSTVLPSGGQQNCPR